MNMEPKLTIFFTVTLQIALKFSIANEFFCAKGNFKIYRYPSHTIDVNDMCATFYKKIELQTLSSNMFAPYQNHCLRNLFISSINFVRKTESIPY